MAGATGSNTSGWNLYAYAGSDPINYYDPSGENMAPFTAGDTATADGTGPGAAGVEVDLPAAPARRSFRSPGRSAI